jgi:prevent-host-death family protein
MANLTTTEARTNFAELINTVSYAKDTTILTKHGKEVAAIIPIEDLRYYEELEDERDLKDALAILNGNEPVITHDKLKEELGLD